MRYIILVVRTDDMETLAEELVAPNAGKVDVVLLHEVQHDEVEEA